MYYQHCKLASFHCNAQYISNINLLTSVVISYEYMSVPQAMLTENICIGIIMIIETGKSSVCHLIVSNQIC